MESLPRAHCGGELAPVPREAKKPKKFHAQFDLEQKPGKPAETGGFAKIKCDLSWRDIAIWRLGLLLEVSTQVDAHLWFGI